MQIRPFPVIDPVATGNNIRRLRMERGMTVREMQAYFGFEQPQAIYKWQQGTSLPSVDNLYALGALLEVPMDAILVSAKPNITKIGQQDSSCCPQIIDKVNALPGPEKDCKTRKKGLQIHERTQSYVIEFAASFDDVSKNLFEFPFVRRDFCICGLCQRSGAAGFFLLSGSFYFSSGCPGRGRRREALQPFLPPRHAVLLPSGRAPQTALAHSVYTRVHHARRINAKWRRVGEASFYARRILQGAALRWPVGTMLAGERPNAYPPLQKANI